MVYAEDEQFIECWQRCSCVKEVAAELQIKYEQAVTRVVRLRKRGVPLKKFKTGSAAGHAWNRLHYPTET